jgi:hypothetical protein
MGYIPVKGIRGHPTAWEDEETSPPTRLARPHSLVEAREEEGVGRYPTTKDVGFLPVATRGR